MSKIVFDGRDVSRVTVALTPQQKSDSRQEKLRRRQEQTGLRQINLLTSDLPEARDAVKAVADLLRAQPDLAGAVLGAVLSISSGECSPVDGEFPAVLREAAARLRSEATRFDEEAVQSLANLLRSRPDLREHVRLAPAVEPQRDQALNLHALEARIEKLSSLVTSLATELAMSRSGSLPVVVSAEPGNSAEGVDKPGFSTGSTPDHHALEVAAESRSAQMWLKLISDEPHVARAAVAIASRSWGQTIILGVHRSTHLARASHAMASAAELMPPGDFRDLCRAINRLCNEPALTGRILRNDDIRFGGGSGTRPPAGLSPGSRPFRWFRSRINRTISVLPKGPSPGDD